MKKKQLESFLQKLGTFKKPKLKYEQYATSVSLASSILFVIDDFTNAFVCDLGCGCGVFMLGAIQFGAAFSVGFDVDVDALNICQQNIDETELNEFCDIVKVDLMSQNSLVHFYETFDIVITNPPFGIDIKFVEIGLKLLRKGGTLYSLHKTSTRSFIQKKAKEWPNVKAECVAELRWNLDKTYSHQKQKSIDIDVDLFKFLKLL